MSFLHNQVQLTGRLAGDPELYFTSDGTLKASLVLLQDTLSGSSNKPDRFSLVAWAAIGRRAHETLRQHDRLFIQGKLRTRSFVRDGITHFRAEVHLDHFALLKSARATHRLRHQRNPGTKSIDS